MNKIFRGDSWKLASELSDESVDCVVTSPPYWGLRDYGVDGQAGLEEHPQKWVDKMVELCELLRPKLKKSGVMFWNIGETYFGNSSYSEEGRQGYEEKTGMMMNASKAIRTGLPDPKLPERLRAREQFKGVKNNWLQPKQLLGLPWRFAIAMQDKGWILRNSIIWHKPNAMPSSVKDRFGNCYEYVFMFVKSKRYYFDLDAVREPHQSGIRAKFNIRVCEVQKGRSEARLGSVASKEEIEMYDEQEMCGSVINSIGKNPGDVWRITTKPHAFAHFAVFPEELTERMIKCGCSKNGLVLDPFMGSGTVAVVAKRLGRQYLGFELNEKYIKIAERRLAGVKDWEVMRDVDAGLQRTLND